MPGPRRAIHVCTGNPATGDDLTAWLHREGVSVTVCRDAFDVCALAIGLPHVVPDAVLVGLDWLPSDELGVLRHLREVWPNAAIVVYAHGTTESALGLGQVVALAGRAAVEQAIAGHFEELIERARGAGSMDLGRPLRHPVPPTGVTTRPGSADPSPPTTRELGPRSSFEARPGAPAGPPADAVVTPRPPIVTREEFESLMKDVGI